MPGPSTLLAFAAVSAALIAVPGPSVLFIVSRAVASGRRTALLTVVGNAAGVLVQMMLVAFGLGALVARSVLLFGIVKWFGAAYLVWLGVQAIRHRADLGAVVEPQVAAVGRRAALVDGLVVGVANPKSIVFFAALLPQYVVAGGAPLPLQVGVLALVFLALALALDSMWALASGTARNWIVSSPRRLARLRGAGGLTMVGLGLHLALTGRAD